MTPKIRTQYPQEWQALIAEIAAIQDDLKRTKALGKNWSDADLCEGFPKGSGNLWFQLRKGSYAVPKTARGQSGLTATLASLKDHAKSLIRARENAALMARRQSEASDQFIETTEYHAVRAAITSSIAKASSQSEERLVVFVAPTRGGKTMLERKLLAEGLATWSVAATPCWETSYMAMLRTLARALQLPADSYRSAESAETEVLAHLRGQTGVMIVSEIQLVSRRGKALLKTILNETTITLVLMMTPEYHAALLLRRGADTDQLLARAEGTINANEITPQLIKSFAPRIWGDLPNSDDRLKDIAGAANELGGLSCVLRVTKMLRALAKGDLPDQAHVTTALRAYRQAVPLLIAPQRRRSR